MLTKEHTDRIRVDLSLTVPSRLVTLGPDAFPVLTATGDGSDSDASVIVAASKYGKGRAVHFGHEKFLAEEAGWEAALMACLDWGLRNGPSAGTVITIGTDVSLRDGHPFSLESGGANYSLELVKMSRAELSINRCQLFVTSSYSASNSDQILSFVASGGCLLSGGHAWYWGYSNPGKSALSDFPGNRWLCPLGLAVTSVSANHCDTLRPAQNDAGGLVAMLTAATLEPGLDDAAAAALKFAGDQVFVRETIGLPSFDAAWKALRDSAFSAGVSTISKLLAVGVDLSLWLVPLLLRENLNSPPGAQLIRCPAPDSFPGELLEASGAESSLTIETVVDATYSGLHKYYQYAAAGAPVWRQTGAYAPPGSLVELTVAPSMANKGLQMLIGCHTDIVPLGKQRPPRIHCLFPITAAQTRGYNPYGGIVYVLIPPGSSLGKHEIQVRGCVPYPVYNLLSTLEESDKQAAAAADVESSPESLWLDELRTTRAPMFELRVPGQLVIAAPTEIGRRWLMLQGPAGLVRLARLWLKIMIAINEFHGVCSGGEERPREERIVLDKAISTGSMHSGYPIMGYLDYDECLLSVDKVLNKGSWGPIHELCHNHQWRLSEFSGTVEASNNLPNVFVHDTILRVSRSCHPSLAPESRQSQRQAYIAAGKRFDADWNVWVALDTFLQLQETFGWEPFKALNRTYRTEEALTHLADGSDQSRIDAYLKLLSVQVSLNLTPFFLAWGFPISEAVQAELSSLPEWRDHPMSG